MAERPVEAGEVGVSESPVHTHSFLTTSYRRLAGGSPVAKRRIMPSKGKRKTRHVLSVETASSSLVDGTHAPSV